MKLNIYDEKITSIQELMNLDLGFIDDLTGKDCECDFLVTKQFLVNVKAFVRNYCDIAEKTKEVVNILNTTQAVQFATKHEENYFETVDKILETKPKKSLKENQEVIDNELSKIGIYRKTEVDENGNITWPKSKENKENNEKSLKLIVNNYYLCKNRYKKWLICKAMNVGYDNSTFYDVEDNLYYNIIAFNQIIDVGNELEYAKKIRAEFEAADKVRETLEEKFDKEREELKNNSLPHNEELKNDKPW